MKKISILKIFLLIFVFGCNKVDTAKVTESDPATNDQNPPSTPSSPTHRIVNFDTDPQGNSFTNRQTLGSEYSSWGVSFSIPSNFPKIIAQSTDPSDAIPVSSPFLLGGNVNTGLSGTEPLTIIFNSNASSIKFYVVDSESTGGTATFKDLNNNVLDTQSFQSLSTGASQLITSSATSVRTIVITNSSGSDGFFIDSLEFDIE